eukprot:365494-Chlamydomonas_euryale.AAC.9
MQDSAEAAGSAVPGDRAWGGRLRAGDGCVVWGKENTTEGVGGERASCEGSPHSAGRCGTAPPRARHCQDFRMRPSPPPPPAHVPESETHPSCWNLGRRRAMCSGSWATSSGHRAASHGHYAVSSGQRPMRTKVPWAGQAIGVMDAKAPIDAGRGWPRLNPG